MIRAYKYTDTHLNFLLVEKESAPYTRGIPPQQAEKTYQRDHGHVQIQGFVLILFPLIPCPNSQSKKNDQMDHHAKAKGKGQSQAGSFGEKLA